MDEEVEKEMDTDNPTSDSNDDEDEELEKRAVDLERQIGENKYLYDIHIELIELYRKLSDLNSMRNAYERFHNLFPLTPTLWLSWINDEIKLAHSPEDKKNILNLFDQAVEDYQSVKLWQEYAQFAIGTCTVDETRQILERGLNSVGLHATEGFLIWDTLREFEMAHLSLAIPESEKFQTQLSRVVEVYRRQLSVPLVGMGNTYEEWKDFLKQLTHDHGINAEPIEWGYKNALKTLDLYKSFEERLGLCDGENELYEIYKEYIKSVQDPSLILCLYERAVTQLCLNPDLWDEYCCYAMKLGDLALKISRRSLDNCPWSVQLWIARLRIIEHLALPNKDALECFEDAVKSLDVTQMLALWLSYIEYLKRTVDDQVRLNRICEQAKQQLGTTYDPTSKVTRLQARLAAADKDMTLARKLWSDIFRSPENKACGTFWIEFLALERQYGDQKQVRSVFHRAIANCLDWQAYFADEWLMYEREIGTLQDVMNCGEKCKKYIKVTSDNRTPGKKKDDVLLSQKFKKRIYDEDNEGTQYKKQKVTDNVKSSKKIVPNQNYRNEMKQQKQKDDKMEIDNIKHLHLGPPTDLDPAKAIFVSNLNSNIDEDRLKELFPNSLKITIPRRRGASRCFAYVQFANDNEAQEALKRDREPLDSRPVFISECKTDRKQRQPVFKYSDKTEYNKLFVKGLPQHFTKEDVEALFKPYSATDIRMVNKFNGQFKGLAYVDFANDEDADKALKATDNMTIGEHTIGVAISAPPNKKKELIAPAKLPTRNSKSKLEIPFVPRSVQVKKLGGGGDEVVQTVSKTNNDFRKMLLNK